MPKITVLCAPPGAGKSSYCDQTNYFDRVRISQDEQGKEGYLNIFKQALKDKKDLIIDRMNFSIEQRARYLNPAKELGYNTEIVVLHQNYEICLKRCLTRRGHPTIEFGDEKSAKSALQTFFTKYERPTPDEADVITFVYPEPKMKLNAILIDIDNTLSDASHREFHLQGPKKNWAAFFEAMDKDPVNDFCKLIINKFKEDHIIILSSGRPDSYRNTTEKWLSDNKIHYDHLFMRSRADSRPDQIVKEIIYDFEVLTRVTNLRFAVDDRSSVISMMRARGVRVLDCAGNTF